MDKDSILFANEGEERCVEIQKQLQYLQWRKNQVEGKIRKFALDAKQADESNTLREIQASLDKVEERARWTEDIVQSELAKPWELSRQFVLDFEAQTQKIAEAQELSAEHHLKALEKTKRMAKYRGNYKGDLKRTIQGIERDLRNKTREFKAAVTNRIGVP